MTKDGFDLNVVNSVRVQLPLVAIVALRSTLPLFPSCIYSCILVSYIQN
jgi:hypothetical protein